MKNIILFAFLVTITILVPQRIYAREQASASSATIKPTEFNKVEDDYRVKIVEKYLKSYGSPMTENAKDFVYYADKYNLDWRLVLAISGVESTYGKQIPPYSYNGWGWGVYGDNVIRFKSWKQGIETVSQGLREQYINKWGGQNVYQIGAIYASSPHWANSVNIHLNMIQKFVLASPQNTLSLSL
nr:glucosaminidase domain-containing protein [Candidatus Levybacteria bacterium]